MAERSPPLRNGKSFPLAKGRLAHWRIEKGLWWGIPFLFRSLPEICTARRWNHKCNIQGRGMEAGE
jgi:hypothetical protein